MSSANQQYTNNLVSNLRAKINEFKSKKEQEKAERVDVLNFEINKDFVNQFKKNKQTDNSGEPNKILLNTKNLTNMNEFTLQNPKDKKSVSQNIINSQDNNNTNFNSQPKTVSSNNQILLGTTISNQISNQSSNTKPILNVAISNNPDRTTPQKSNKTNSKLNFESLNKFLLQDKEPISGQETRKATNFKKQNSSFLNTSQDDMRRDGVESKKSELMNLFNKQLSGGSALTDKSPSLTSQFQGMLSDKPPTVASNYQNYGGLAKQSTPFEKRVKTLMDSNNNRNKNLTKRSTSFECNRPMTANPRKYLMNDDNKTKDKIQKFMFQLDSGSTTGSRKELNKYNFSSNQKSENFQLFKQKIPYPNKKFGLSSNQNHEIDDFADFSLKNNNIENTKIPAQMGFMDFDNNNNRKLLTEGRLRSFNNTSSSSTSSNQINLNDVRALNGKIRFLSKEDAANIDRGIANELLNLANNIKRLFDQ